MAHNGGLAPLFRVSGARDDNTQTHRAWWKWWPLAAAGVSVSAWLAYRVDVLYASFVASVAVYALVDALERGRSTLHSAVAPVAWAAGAWLAGVTLGNLAGWSTGNSVVLGAWGVAVGAAVVALVLILRRTLHRSR